ncbi:hypothetical protein REPUB_Repub13aG0240300 [Reevesia pubescens]
MWSKRQKNQAYGGYFFISGYTLLFSSGNQVRETKNEPGRGGVRGSGRGRGRGRGRGGSGFNRDSNLSDNSNEFSGAYRPSEEGEGGRQAERRGYGGPRGSFHGGRRGGFNEGESGEDDHARRQHDRRSGTGRGNEFKRDGAGRGDWGSPTDEVASETEENVPENEKNVGIEMQSGEEDAADASKEKAANEADEKEPENKSPLLVCYNFLTRIDPVLPNLILFEVWHLLVSHVFPT